MVHILPLFSVLIKSVEQGTVRRDFLLEVLDAFKGLLLLGLVELLLGECIVLVYRSGEGREAGADGAEDGGGNVGVGGREGGEIFSEGRGLFEGAIEGCVLFVREINSQQGARKAEGCGLRWLDLPSCR